MTQSTPPSDPTVAREIVRPTPILRADAMAYVMFRRRDLEEMDRFLRDFGLLPQPGPGSTRYYRGHGPAPFLVAIEPAPEDGFVGFGVRAKTRAELVHLSTVKTLPIEAAEGPGGGERVRLIAPDGLVVDVIHGAAEAEPLPTRTSLTPTNTPAVKARVNAGVRTPLEPSPIFKLGHVVLQRPDFDAAADWYMEHLGLIASDVQVLANGAPAMGFFRLDRGPEPADHHSLAILGGPAPGLLHVSFETFDIEAVGQGHQYLRARGWTPFWGVGRHALGSQVFDYWKDPVGVEWEHYADGDVMDASHPTGYHRFSRGTLWTWGDDLPDALRPDLSADDIPAIHAAGGFGPMPLERVDALMRALLIPPRPWMR
jgi:hypothetical protein